MCTDEFLLLCEAYAKSLPKVLAHHAEDSKKCCVYHIECYSYSLEFRYIKKESVYVRPSALYCVLKLRKNSVVHYHLTDILPFLEKQDFKSCYFWHIENPERMRCCFRSLEAMLDLVLSQIEPFLADDAALENALFQSYIDVFGLKDSDIDFAKVNDKNDAAYDYFSFLQAMRDEYLFSRYSTFPPYALLLKNKVDKALKKYEKFRQKKALLEYEKRLIDHVTHAENREFHAFDPDCDTTTVVAKMQSPVRVIQEFVRCFIVFSVLFCGLFCICNVFLSMNTLVLLSAPWYSGFVCAALCSIFGAVACSTWKPGSKACSKEEQGFSDVLYSKGIRWFTWIAFILSIVASAFFAVMIPLSNVQFTEDGIRFEDRSYSYTQIESVYHIDARYNMYGDRIERASYVILFDDKTSLDLDGYASEKTAEEEVLPLLKQKGFPVCFADSERELPWYSQEE